MTRSAVPPTLQERKHQLVRTAIWDAAMDLFADKGYDETTVDEIADRAGVSRRSFFRYFASKSDLFASGIVEYGDSIAAAIKACPSSAPVPDVIRQTVLQVAGQVAAHPNTRKVMQLVSQNSAAREALHSRSTELRARVKAAFAARSGPFRRLDAGLLTGLTLSTLDAVFHYWFEKSGRDIHTAVEQVLNTMECMAPSRH